MNIHLHIDELVLHGFAPGDRYHIAEAVQAELSCMLVERGVPAALAQGGSAERVATDDFNMGAAPRPAIVGRQIAQAVYGGLDAWASE
jgi:hypothetical protein